MTVMSGRQATIATMQTAAGAGGIAVVLLAGPRTRGILAGIFRDRRGAPWPTSGHGARRQELSGRLLLGELHDGGVRLDEAVIRLQRLGEGEGDLAEINIHGGPRITQRVLQLLARAGSDIRPWDAALAARWGVWPLSAAGRANPAIGRELLEWLPRARTKLAGALLMHQWDGGLSELAEQALAALRAGAESESLAPALAAAADRLAAVARLLHPAEVVLAGPPNAGKSSLANVLIGRDACIVTDAPGTTRDWVRELADIRGCAVWLTDTAGLWAPPGELEAEAVRRAWARIDGADLVLAVFDAADPPAEREPHWRRLLARDNVLGVANKSDVAGYAGRAIGVSARTRAGLDALHLEICRRLGVDNISADMAAAFTPRQARLGRLAAQAMGRDGDEAIRHLSELLGR